MTADDVDLALRMRSDEGPPMTMPPGEDPPPQVQEPPDKPAVGPDAPVREPEPRQPRRLQPLAAV